MLHWAVVFFILALVAGALGLTEVAGAAAGMAKILFVIFLALFILSVGAGALAGRKIVRGPPHR